MVTDMTVPEASVPWEVVMTIDDSDGADAEPSTPPLMKTVGAAPAAKKPFGYASVTLPPSATVPLELVLNANVAATLVFAATRCKCSISKVVCVTAVEGGTVVGGGCVVCSTSAEAGCNARRISNTYHNSL